jgi:Family of unknown function (DUF6481)
MTGFKIPNFNDRLSSAQKAKQAALEKFKAKPGPSDPEFQARQAERVRIEAERQARKEAAKLEKVRLEAEAEVRRKAELEAKKLAEQEAYEAEVRAQEELEAKQKAIRDARYAARKAAKKG